MGISPIALGINPPQPTPGPMDNYGKMIGLQNLMQEQQLRKGEIQLQQQQLKDQQAMTTAMKGWDGKNPDDLQKSIISNGGSANAALAASKHFLDYRDTASQIALRDAQTGETNLKNLKEKHNQYLGAIESAKQASDADLLPTLTRTISQLIPDEGADPQAASFKQQAGQLLQSGAPPKQIRDSLTILENGLKGQQEQIEQGQKIAETASAAAKLPGEKAESDTKQMEAEAMKKFGGMTGPMADARYRFIEQNKALGKTPSADDAAFAKAYEKQKTLVPTANFNLQNAGATGTAGQPSAIAQALASGSMKWQDAVSPRTPMSVKTALLAEVKGIKPDFNTGDFQVEQKVKEEATSGAVGKQLLAIGTAREHMKLFSELADKLDNNDTQALNKIGNAIGVQFGSDKATNLKIASQAFGGEVGRAFDGAGVIGREREEAAASFSDKLSKGQFKGAVETVDALLAGKQRAAHAWFDAGTKAKPDFGQEGGGQGGQVQVTDPRGAVHKFPNQAAADAFKKLANIQ